MIIGDEKDRGKRKIGIIKNIFMGKENAIRSIRRRTVEKDYWKTNSFPVSNQVTLLVKDLYQQPSRWQNIEC